MNRGREMGLDAQDGVDVLASDRAKIQPPARWVASPNGEIWDSSQLDLTTSRGPAGSPLESMQQALLGPEGGLLFKFGTPAEDAVIALLLRTNYRSDLVRELVMAEPDLRPEKLRSIAEAFERWSSLPAACVKSRPLISTKQVLTAVGLSHLIEDPPAQSIIERLRNGLLKADEALMALFNRWGTTRRQPSCLLPNLR